MAKIIAPNQEFTGKRGQVVFADGVAETDDPAMLAYFRRHGYTVEEEKAAKKAAPAKKAAADEK